MNRLAKLPFASCGYILPAYKPNITSPGFFKVTEPTGLFFQADERAKAMRESVDVMRLSQIVQSNLESEMNDNATPDAEITADNQVHLMNADAEVDFRERSEEGKSS